MVKSKGEESGGEGRGGAKGKGAGDGEKFVGGQAVVQFFRVRTRKVAQR